MLNFLIVALAIFLLVRGINRLRRQEPATVELFSWDLERIGRYPLFWH